MLKGAGRYALSGDRFAVRPSTGPGNAPQSRKGVAYGRSLGMSAARHAETALTAVDGVPSNTVSRAFAKPVAMPLNVGLVSDHPQAQILLNREIFDNDPIAGSVAEIMGSIPFGRFTLSGMPDVKHQEPYLRSLDHLRLQALMPVIATTYLTDGAFLGSGLFDSGTRSWNAIVLQDLLNAQVYPAPYFGASPVVDVTLTEEMERALQNNDPRLARYRRFATHDLRKGSVQQLQPENTFYIPRVTHAKNSVMGQSMFRRVQILYVLEKALMRGTVEMAYRRQKPIIHIQCGDETWDATTDEMKEIMGMFMGVDFDPTGGFVVTRPGVLTQEVGGPNDGWKITDNMEQLAAAKLKGLGMPDGLLGGDVSLDSLSATLTVFINMVRMLRDFLTRAFLYDKVFPYVAVTNDHLKERLGAYEEHGNAELANYAHQHRYRSIAADLEVDMSKYLLPTVTYHNSMRPEGDRDYFAMLQEATNARIPVPLRVQAAALGLDMHDILNGSRDDLDMRGQAAKYQAEIDMLSGAEQEAQGGAANDDQGGFDQGGGYAATGVSSALGHVPRRRGLANREYDDRYLPRNNINGHAYVTTASERRRLMDCEDRMYARALDLVARRENHYGRHVHRVIDPLRVVSRGPV